MDYRKTKCKKAHFLNIFKYTSMKTDILNIKKIYQQLIPIV